MGHRQGQEFLGGNGPDLAGAAGDLVEGQATEFCQVVAQTRALKDTSLRVEGDVAREWMSIAQCFAGPPENPPAPGSRFMLRPS